MAGGHPDTGRLRQIDNGQAGQGTLKPGVDLDVLYDPEPQGPHMKRLHLILAAALFSSLALGAAAFYVYRMNRRMDANRKRHLAVFNSAPVAFVVVDQQQTIVDWNKAAERIFGWSREEVRGRNMLELLVPEAERERVICMMAVAAEDAAATCSINRNMTRDGRILLCEWQKAPYCNDQGQALGLLLVGMDITERHALERQLRNAKEDAEELLADQRQFLAMLSHELRSPLAVIDSNCQVMALHCDAGCKSAFRIARIRGGVKRLANFLDNCLTQDRLDSQGWVLALQEIVLGPFLYSVLQQENLITAGHILELDNPDSSLVVQADPHLLSILLHNLLDNAAKYSPVNSVITVMARTDGRRLALTVQDQGMGIAPEDRERVLKRYHRGRNVARISGAGMGLALVAHIVALHDGELQLGGAVGKGARVTVHLPLRSVRSRGPARESGPTGTDAADFRQFCGNVLP